MNAFRDVFNEATGDQGSDLYQALHGDNGELTSEGRSFMQNLALAGQGNSVLMSDGRIGTYFTKSSLVGGTLSENFADYQFGAKGADGKATRESEAVAADIAPTTYNTGDKGFLNAYTNAIATGEMKQSAEQRGTYESFKETNAYKSMAADRRGMFDGTLAGSNLQASGSINYKDTHGTPKTADLRNLDSLAEASRVGNLSSAQRTAIDGAILGAVTSDVSKVSLSNASAFSAGNQEQAIKVTSEGLGKVSTTRFDQVMGSGDTAAANRVINRAVSGAENGSLNGVSSTQRDQMASRVSDQIMTAGSQFGSSLVGNVASGFSSTSSDAKGMSAMIGAKMMGDANFSRLNSVFQSEVATGVGQNLGSIASSDRDKILGSPMVASSGGTTTITANGQVVRAATNSSETVSMALPKAFLSKDAAISSDLRAAAVRQTSSSIMASMARRKSSASVYS